MSMKPIDLQMAVHRNVDASDVQNELSQKPVNHQSMLTHGAEKLIENERHMSSEVKESADRNIGDENRKSPSEQEQQEHESQEHQSKQDSENAKHPYKGQHIDLTL